METAKINVKDRDLLEAVQRLLKKILTQETIEAVLVPKRLPVGAMVMPTLVSDPARLEGVDSLAPAFALNTAKVVSRLTRGPLAGRLAVMLRPCEIRAFIELVKLNQGSTEELVILGMDCLGACGNKDYLELAGDDPAAASRRFYKRVLEAQFPTNHCGMCRMLPLLERDAGSQFCLRKGLFHENIEILTATRLTAVEGEPGRFTVRLRQSWNGVQPDLCMGCGLCASICPVEVADGFNLGLSRRKAIYLPVPHSVPSAFVIDPAACTRCGACAAVCPTQAIDLADNGRKDFPILVVDDELAVRDSLKEWLLDEGYGAVEAMKIGALRSLSI